MSYVVHVWEAPHPVDLGEADRMHARLSRQRPGQNRKFIELAKILAERFPPDDLDGVWSEGETDGVTDDAVLSLGVRTSGLGDLLPFLAEAANALGLTVYDDQAAQAWLPGGKVLTAPGRAPMEFAAPTAAAGTSVLDSYHATNAAIRAALAPVLEPHGFRFVKREISFVRRHGACDQRLCISGNDWEGDLTNRSIHMWFDPLVEPELEPLIKLPGTDGWVSIDFKTAADLAGHPRMGDKPEFTTSVRIRNEAELERWIARIIRLINEVVMPIANRCNSLADLDQEANACDGVSVFGQFADHLRLSYATRNPRFFELLEAKRRAAEAEQRQYAYNLVVGDIKAFDETRPPELRMFRDGPGPVPVGSK